MTPDDPQTGAYARFLGEFMAWHFQATTVPETGVQPNSVPTSPDTKEREYGNLDQAA